MTETKVTTLRMPAELIAAIEEYRQAEGLRSWSFATIDLINLSLRTLGYQTAQPKSWGGHGRKESDGQQTR